MPYVLINGQLRNKQDVNLENFNGYVIFPQAQSGTWTEENRLKQVDDVINDFSKNYKGGVKIDEDHIALSGHSMGGMGAAYFAQHYNGANLTHKLSKVAIMSGFNHRSFNLDEIKESGIDIRAYVGDSDSSGSKTFTNSFGKKFNTEDEKKAFTVKAGHGSVPENAYILDENQNGISDYMEWLFS